MRCVRAHRSCSGYEHDLLSSFRRYEVLDTTPISGFLIKPRKCTLPKRIPLPGTSILPRDDIPPETSQDESNILGLRCFFFDYHMPSANKNLSRSCFSSLEARVHRLGPKSDLVKACLTVSFASHGKPLNRPRFVRKAQQFHQELLGSLARSISCQLAVSTTTDLKLIALLMGLYQVTKNLHASFFSPSHYPFPLLGRILALIADTLQMIITDEGYHGDHVAHARGLSALMKTTCPPSQREDKPTFPSLDQKFPVSCMM
jgi:hypothetical protein